MNQPPEVVKYGDEVIVAWPSLKFKLEFREFRKTNWGLQAEVAAVSMIPGASATLCPRQMGLRNGRDMLAMTSALQRKLGDAVADVADYVEDAFQIAGEAYLHEEDSVDLADVDFQGPPPFLIPNFLQQGVNNIMAAPRGSAKSYISMSIAIAVATKRLVAGGLFDTNEQAPVLYLDWEDSRHSQASRLDAVAKGLGLRERPRDIRHRKMRHTIFDSAKEIRREVERYGVGLVIVDSIGVACRGDISDSDLAIRAMSECCSSWEPATRLVIAHVPKADGSKGPDQRSVIGSQFFESDARTVWQLQGEDVEQGIKEVGFFNTKMSNGPKPENFALRLDFTGDSSCVTITEAEGIPNAMLMKSSGVRSQIVDAMRKENADVTVAQIVDITGFSAKQIQNAMPQLVRQRTVVALNDAGPGVVKVYALRADREA